MCRNPILGRLSVPFFVSGFWGGLALLLGMSLPCAWLVFAGVFGLALIAMALAGSIGNAWKHHDRN